MEFKRPRSPNDSLVVDQVHAKLCAECAGVKPGDTIVEWNGKPTPNWMEWRKNIAGLDLLAGEKADPESPPRRRKGRRPPADADLELVVR